MYRLGTASTGNTLLYDSPGYIEAVNILTAAAAVTELSLYDAGTKSLGAEMVSLGDLSAATGWTAGSGWTISGGKATHTGGGGTNALSQSACAPVAASIYKVTYTLGHAAAFAGSVVASIGGVNDTTRTVKGTYTSYIRASSTAALAFTPSNDFDGYVDDVSVKKISDASYIVATLAHPTNADSKLVQFDGCIPVQFGILTVLTGTGATAQIYG